MKKLLVAMIVVTVAFVTNAAYLYWQVDSGDMGGTSYNYANLHGTYSDANTVLQTVKVGEQNSFDVSNFENYSFYIELVNSVNGSNQTVGIGESQTYAQLSALNFILEGPLSQTQAQVWHGGAYAAPEPTSGFLMMVGLALLGLKRRKV